MTSSARGFAFPKRVKLTRFPLSSSSSSRFHRADFQRSNTAVCFSIVTRETISLDLERHATSFLFDRILPFNARFPKDRLSALRFILLSPKFWFLSKSLPKLGWPWTHRMFWMFFDILAMSNCFSRRFRFRFYQWIQPRDKTKRWNYSKLAYEILRITLLLFRCRKPDWHESGSRKRRAERPSWAKRRRLRPDWPRRRAAFSWTTTTRRRIFSNCNIIIYFVV